MVGVRAAQRKSIAGTGRCCESGHRFLNLPGAIIIVKREAVLAPSPLALRDGISLRGTLARAHATKETNKPNTLVGLTFIRFFGAPKSKSSCAILTSRRVIGCVINEPESR